MLYTDRTIFPKRQTVTVPHYRIEAFDGKSLELIQTSQRVEVDFGALDARSIAQATGVQREGWEIHGLIALDAQPLAMAMDQAFSTGKGRQFGTVLREAWYFVDPIEMHFSPRTGDYVVVGLYR